MRPSPIRAEYHRWNSDRIAPRRARPATSEASAMTRPGRPLSGGFVPMPSSMIFLKMSGFRTSATDAMTMTARNPSSSFRYGAANRTIRLPVPGASFFPTTAGSRRNDRIICQGATPSGPMATPSDASPSEGGDPGEGPADDQLLDLAGPLVQRRNPGIPQVLPGGVLV